MVRRVTGDQPATVMLAVIDTCGEWSTLVGAGPGGILAPAWLTVAFTHCLPGAVRFP
jgi:hypothetical protein